MLRARWENHSTFQSFISKERNLFSLYEDYAIFRFDRKPVGYVLQKHWWFIKLHVCGMVFRGTVALVVILRRSWCDVRLQPPGSNLFLSRASNFDKMIKRTCNFTCMFFFLYITSNENTLKIRGKILKIQFTTLVTSLFQSIFTQ